MARTTTLLTMSLPLFGLMPGFTAESVIHAPPQRIFAFHALPDALERLTPSRAGSRVIEHVRSLEAGARTIGEIRVAPFVWIRPEFVHRVCEPSELFVSHAYRHDVTRAWCEP